MVIRIQDTLHYLYATFNKHVKVNIIAILIMNPGDNSRELIALLIDKYS